MLRRKHGGLEVVPEGVRREIKEVRHIETLSEVGLRHDAATLVVLELLLFPL